MKYWASGRLASVVIVTAFVAAFAKPADACTAAQCPSNNAELQGVSANALPTYQEAAAEPASEPIKLKKFTKQATGAAKRSQPRKAQLAQRAKAGKLAAAHRRDQEEAGAKAKSTKTVAFANANAQFVDAAVAKTVASPSPFDRPQAPPPVALPPAGGERQATEVQPPTVELVSAEEFNELDRAAWEANQMPKLMQLKVTGDSRAELRDDDSRWAQTSTIGKIFVAFGALLTLGSAIRMFIA